MKTFTLFFTFSLAIAGIGFSEELNPNCYYQGQIDFKTEHFNIVLKNDLRGFIFKTATSPNYDVYKNDNRRLGKLIIDSLIFRDSIVPFYDSRFTGLFAIHSPELLFLLDSIKVRKLVRASISTETANIMIYNEIRGKWVFVPDMSKWYLIYFPEDNDEIKIVEKLSQLIDIRTAELVPKPCCEFKPTTEFIINDEPPKFGERQSSFSNQEIIDAVYGDYNHPCLANFASLSRRNIFYLYSRALYSAYERSKYANYGLCTDNFDTAKSWIKKMIAVDSTYKYAIDSILQNEKYYEFFISNIDKSSHCFIRRIHRSSYFDNSESEAISPFYEMIYGDSAAVDTLGIYKAGIYSNESCRKLLLYLIEDVYPQSSGITLSFYKATEDCCGYIHYYLAINSGDYCMYDSILLFKNEYNVDRSTGLVTVKKRFLKEYQGRYNDYEW